MHLTFEMSAWTFRPVYVPIVYEHIMSIALLLLARLLPQALAAVGAKGALLVFLRPQINLTSAAIPSIPPVALRQC